MMIMRMTTMMTRMPCRPAVFVPPHPVVARAESWPCELRRSYALCCRLSWKWLAVSVLEWLCSTLSVSMPASSRLFME